MFVGCATLLFIALVVGLPSDLDAVKPSTSTASSDETLLSGSRGLKAHVSKKGANIRVYREVAKGKDSGTFEVFLDTLEELDSNLNPLQGDHKTSSFSNIDFTVTQPLNVSLPLAKPSGVSAACINCTATLSKVGKSAQISLSVCAIAGNATLDLGGELTNVTDGQLKITLTVVDWPWAATTNKLAADIVIKIPPGRRVAPSAGSRGKPTKFTFSNDSMIEFSNMVNIDNGSWIAMPADYPQYTSHGANNNFRLILGHFDKNAIYDPNLEVGSQCASSGHTTVVPRFCVLIILFLVAAKLSF